MVVSAADRDESSESNREKLRGGFAVELYTLQIDEDLLVNETQHPYVISITLSEISLPGAPAGTPA